MPALVVPELGRAEVEEWLRPEPAADAVLVKVHYSGVSAGTERWIATGKHDWFGAPPFVTGYQAAGQVVAVGRAVTAFAEGDVVCAFGVHAHAAYLETTPDLVHRLPDADAAVAASLFVQPAVGENSLSFAGVNASDTVLVVGQGLIGQATAQLARLRGAYVVASDVAPRRLELSRAHCADWVIDANERPLPEFLLERFPDGVDVVVESTGFTNLLDDAFSCAAVNGRFVFEGYHPGEVRFDFSLPHVRELRVFFPCGIGSYELREGIVRLLASGRLPLRPLVSHVVPWREAASIYASVLDGDGDAVNGVVIDWRDA